MKCRKANKTKARGGKGETNQKPRNEKKQHAWARTHIHTYTDVCTNLNKM